GRGPGGQDAAVHRAVPFLRDQLQPGPRPRGRVRGAVPRNGAMARLRATALDATAGGGSLTRYEIREAVLGSVPGPLAHARTRPYSSGEPSYLVSRISYLVSRGPR